MLAVLRDQGLEKYVEKDAGIPKASEEPTNEEKDTIQKWKDGNAKAHTRIELSIGDSKMIHLSSTNMAREMWNQLVMVKEAQGQLGILAT